MSGTKIKHTMISDIINLVSLILYYFKYTNQYARYCDSYQ